MKNKTFENFLPKQKPVEVPSGVMVRPDKETIVWLAQKAHDHGVSVNKIVLAIIEAEKAREVR